MTTYFCCVPYNCIITGQQCSETPDNMGLNILKKYEVCLCVGLYYIYAGS